MSNEQRQPPTGAAWGRAATWLATGLGVGYSPTAPGTVGSLWGLPLVWAIGQIPSSLVQIAVVAAIILVGIPVCELARRHLQGGKDPGCIVYDEFASLPVVFLIVPATGWPVVAAGFLLFRLFDVTKPPPIGWLERLPGGLGIMADDTLAAFYAGVVLLGAQRLLTWAGAV